MGKIIFCIILILLISTLFFSHYFIENRHLPPQVNQSHILTPTKVVVKNCPSGFIQVPGNKLYGTHDFCVMKYDAKCAEISNPTVGLAPPPGNGCSGRSVDGGYGGVYKNNRNSCGCVLENNREIVSTKSGFPITYIAMSDNSSNNAKHIVLIVDGISSQIMNG